MSNIEVFTKGLFTFITDPIDIMTDLTNNYVHFVYLIVFVLMFLENCSLIFSWIPAQSMIFILGTLSTQHNNYVNPVILWAGFILTAQAGTMLKYRHGEKLGTIKNKHLSDSANFVRNHETSALLLSNFIPVIGLLVPIIGGREKLEVKRFTKLTTLGTFLWVTVLMILGYFLGQIPWVHKHYAIIVVGIAVLPILIDVLWNFFENFKYNLATQNI
jgi:membrane-associated protein